MAAILFCTQVLLSVYCKCNYSNTTKGISGAGAGGGEEEELVVVVGMGVLLVIWNFAVVSFELSNFDTIESFRRNLDQDMFWKSYGDWYCCSFVLILSLFRFKLTTYNQPARSVNLCMLIRLSSPQAILTSARNLMGAHAWRVAARAATNATIGGRLHCPA
ncbi:hypothetical protein BaRGS_00007469 [Batillaria attramentaria]|uniref:Uncharacterized protein n=1 Tax=Batillaria attramentaria TaxID=370345 RepID=A0ABD0LPD2_9CAEN